MALINCKECGKEISSKSKTCPNCGYSQKGNLNYLVIIIIVILLVAITSFITFKFLSISSNQDKSQTTKQDISLTKNEKYAVDCILNYKNMLKNPESLQVHDIRWYTNEGVPSMDIALFIDVSAQNSFGGNTRNVIIYGIQSGVCVYGGSDDDIDSEDDKEQTSAMIIQYLYPDLKIDDNAKISVERVMAEVNKK